MANCSVCLELFNCEERCPRILPSCGHTFCTSCLARLFDDSSSSITCPLDKGGVKVDGALSLPINRALLDILGIAAAVPPSPALATAAICEKHKQPIQHFDSTCSALVCNTCLSYDHHGHKCTSLSEAGESSRAALRESAGRWESRRDGLRNVHQTVLAENELLNINSVRGAEVIEAAFARLRARLAEREGQLIAELNAGHKAKDFALGAQCDHLDEVVKSLTGLCDSARLAIHSQDHVTAIKAHLELTASPRVRDAFGAIKLRPDESAYLAVAIETEEVERAIAAMGAVATARGSPSGEYLRAWGSKGSEVGQFNSPTRMCFYNRNLFVSDYDNNRVQVFTPTGEFVRQIGTGLKGRDNGSLDGPCGLVVSPDLGTLYIADCANHRIQAVSHDGVFLHAFGAHGSRDGELQNPTGIAMEATGRELYVCDRGNSRIQVFSPDGQYLRQWGTSGTENGQFQRIRDIAVSFDGTEVYVSDFPSAGRGPHRVQVFSPTGAFLRAMGGASGNGSGQFMYPTCIALTGAGTLLVCDWGNDRVQEIHVADGTMVKAWGIRGAGPGEFRQPTGVAVSADGEVFVTEESGCRIQAFK